MSESEEHKFLKSCTIDVINDFSNTKLFGFTETDRKKFDFSFLIDRNWDRPLVGQVLKGNISGIDKDIRTLVNDPESDIKLYIASNVSSHYTKFEEIISDLRRSNIDYELFKLRTIWIPSEFDAKDRKQRDSIYNRIKSQIIDDILFNIVFDGLSKEHLLHFSATSGSFGLQLAILYFIATEGFISIANLSKRVDKSTSPVREKLQLLHGIGLIDTPIAALDYKLTPKGKVLLELIHQVFTGLNRSVFSAELSFILEKLGFNVCSLKEIDFNDINLIYDPFKLFVHHIFSAVVCWDIDLETLNYSSTNDN